MRYVDWDDLVLLLRSLDLLGPQPAQQPLSDLKLRCSYVLLAHAGDESHARVEQMAARLDAELESLVAQVRDNEVGDYRDWVERGSREKWEARLRNTSAGRSLGLHLISGAERGAKAEVTDDAMVSLATSWLIICSLGASTPDWVGPSIAGSELTERPPMLIFGTQPAQSFRDALLWHADDYSVRSRDRVARHYFFGGGGTPSEVSLHDKPPGEDNERPSPLDRGRPSSTADEGSDGQDTDESNVERVQRELRRARAQRELGEIDGPRAIWHASQQGLSQRQIADLVGRSQPDVGRTLRKVERNPDLLAIRPREVALRRTVGQISTAEMMARLITFPYADGQADPSPLGSGYLPGSWDDVRRLRRESLITIREWEQLFAIRTASTEQPGDLLLPDDPATDVGESGAAAGEPTPEDQE